MICLGFCKRSDISESRSRPRALMKPCFQRPVIGPNPQLGIAISFQPQSLKVVQPYRFSLFFRQCFNRVRNRGNAGSLLSKTLSADGSEIFGV